MSDIKEFKLVRGTVASVEQNVNELLDVGWEPHGVVFKMIHDKQEIVVQGMVRVEMFEDVSTPDRQLQAYHCGTHSTHR